MMWCMKFRRSCRGENQDQFILLSDTLHWQQCGRRQSNNRNFNNFIKTYSDAHKTQFHVHLHYTTYLTTNSKIDTKSFLFFNSFHSSLSLQWDVCQVTNKCIFDRYRMIMEIPIRSFTFDQVTEQKLTEQQPEVEDNGFVKVWVKCI
ncbi:hypothetical protein FQA39_LY07475 [Lamprigera yunnana]|nr:hypothetical protein FQA39_LY07475 [Lamprigera yunnana]